MTNKLPEARRATTIEELEEIVSKFIDKEVTERGLAFKPQPTDVIISPYAKCGTTWLQHMAHGLRTRGDMEFEEISVVAPWIEVAYGMDLDLDAPQVAPPRIFKSHVSYHQVPKGARYVVSFRHYYDAGVSFYRFFENWFFESGTIDIETLLRWRWQRELMDKEGYWYHLASWWEQRHNKHVLLLCYEDMVEDLPTTVKRLAEFIGIPLDDDLLDIVVRQSSREFMLAHKDKFHERLTAEKFGKRANLPPPIENHKVTTGAKNEPKYQLSDNLKQYLDDIWHEQITIKFGLETYEDLRHELRLLHQLH